MTGEATVRARLMDWQAGPEAQAEAAAGDCRPVALDPQPVGRLSHQDCLKARAAGAPGGARQGLLILAGGRLWRPCVRYLTPLLQCGNFAWPLYPNRS